MRSHPEILLVIEGTWPWYRGGVSEWVHQYIRAFDDARFTIAQVATDQYRRASLDEAVYQVPGNVAMFERVPSPVFNGSWQQNLQDWWQENEQSLGKLAASADIIHVANTGFAGWLGMKLASAHSKPLVLTEHALYWKEVQMGAVALECGYKIPDDGIQKREISNLFKDIARQVYQSADKLISVSQCNIPEQQKLGAGDVAYIPNGVDESWFREEKQRNQKLTVGWIGRCAEMKNPLKFIEVAESFGASADCLMMLCEADESGLKRKVKQQAARISNLELIWNRPASEHIDKMDALCITSHNESQPLVLFEALSRKILPFGWQTGDVTPRLAVTLEEDQAPGELVELVLGCWRNPQKWEDQLNSRYERAKRHHSWQKIFKSYREELEPYLTLSAATRF